MREQGLTEVARWAIPAVPYPHALHYYDEWDAAETELLNLLRWHRKPLRDEDVQFWSGPTSANATVDAPRNRRLSGSRSRRRSLGIG